jgi:hypothetical protein
MVASQPSAGLRITDTWKGHDFEPWIAAWDRWQPTFLYTGNHVWLSLSKIKELCRWGRLYLERLGHACRI